MAFIPPKEMMIRLEESLKQYNFLTEQLSQPMASNDRNSFMKLSKERSDLEKIIEPANIFQKHLSDYQGARNVLETENDADLRAMANEEIGSLEKVLEQEALDLQLLMLPKDPNDEKNVILEIRQGVGGDEAGLFAGEMFDAYLRYAASQGWKTEVMEIADNSAGGVKEAIATIDGDSVYSKLKYESGVHRVQRVPKTEARGRVHTSTITVAILPEAEDVDVKIEDKDLRTEVFRSSGAGGQHVNKTESAVRITHVPTGEVVVCREEKSQIKNRAKAMKVLKARLHQKAQDEINSQQSSARKSQVGTGFRNERIRTYNFPQGRITDHRIGMSVYNVDEVMGGKFQPFIDALHNHYQTALLRGEDPTQMRPVSDDDDA